MLTAENIVPPRGFWTPPPTCKSGHFSPVMPASERRPMSDYSNEIHNLPPNDSPYGRAKRVQLVDKNPNKAVSMFWTAINSGDRVDSALKDMALVMQQLNRPDEAIEAIKSFRHLCPSVSQESLDNMLVELYKRSGRTEEHIDILKAKVKQIEEGLAFGGKMTKPARYHGRWFEITIEQEYARLLGNLAWAYMLQNNYKSAEEMYRKSLSFEQDKNKQCNLAICLMRMNRITEAKFLLRIVRDSSRNREMDESYAKSYEHAAKELAELESEGSQKSTASDGARYENFPKPFSPFACKIPGECFTLDGGQRRGFPQLSGTTNTVNPQCVSPGQRRCFPSSPQDSICDKRRRPSYSKRTSCGSQWKNDKWGSVDRAKESFIFHKESFTAGPAEASSEVLLTQPRRCAWSFGTEDQKKAMVQDVHRKLNFWRQTNAESFPAKSSEAVDLQTISNEDGMQNPNITPTASVKSTEAVERTAAYSEENQEIQSQSKYPECVSPGQRWCFPPSPQDLFFDKWRRPSYSKRARFGSQWKNHKWGSTDRAKETFVFNKESVSAGPAGASLEVLLTQPRRDAWSFGTRDQKKTTVQDVHRKLNFGQERDAENFPEESSVAVDWQAISKGNNVQNPNVTTTGNAKSEEAVIQTATDSETGQEIQSQRKSPREREYQDLLRCTIKKSWADMVEEDEQETC